MRLTKEENEMLEGKFGYPVQKSMEILVGLGECYDAQRMIPVSSAHLLGSLSIGKAGASFNEQLAAKGGKFVTFTDANPLSIEPYQWKALGFPEALVTEQMAIINNYAGMGLFLANTCTPYLVGHSPRPGEHIAWSESSAVVFANSVLGARTNREGGFSSLAAALTGRVPEYGYHLDRNRQGELEIVVTAQLEGIHDYGALGFFAGKMAGDRVSVFSGIPTSVSQDELKHLGAATAASGSVSLFHVVGVTPEAPTREAVLGNRSAGVCERFEFGLRELKDTRQSLFKATETATDLVVFGCPHASINELKEFAGLLSGRKLKPGIELWISTSQPIKGYAEKMGYAAVIEASGSRILCETCPAAMPWGFLKGRGHQVTATNSAQLAFYLSGGQHGLKPQYGSAQRCVEAAVTGQWR